MDLYTDKINEFIEWVGGKNILTDESITEGKDVSGARIRELLQEHLRNPFYVYEDKQSGLYRMFSSKESWQLWAQDRDSYSNLELFNFVRPSDYIVELNNLTSDARYITSGNKEQFGSILQYTWDVKNDKGSYADSITVTYSITSGTGRKTTYSKIYNSTQKSVIENIYDHLDLGQNLVTVLFKASSTGATASVSFSVVMLDLTLSSSFAFTSTHNYGAILPIPFTLKRNDSSNDCSVYIYIDGNQVKKVDIPKGGSLEYGTEITDIINVYEQSTKLNRQVSHILQMWAETEYSGVIFRSNILYYTFQTQAEESISNYFVNVAHSFESGIPPFENFELSGVQYIPITLTWGYYTDQLQNNTSIPIDWKLLQNGIETDIATIIANKGKVSSELSFVPSIYTTDENPAWLIGYYNNNQLIKIPLNISQSSIQVYEAPVYDFKLSAYGKINQSTDKAEWSFNGEDVHPVFSPAIKFDDNSGWYKNSLRLSGTDQFVTIPYNAFSGNPSNGRTIEIEFEPEKVNSADDVLITIGNPTGARIEIKPNTASLYTASGEEKIHTNFKSNERIKLAFIINEQNNDPDSQLLFIVNNGILERAATGGENNFSTEDGYIKIGGSQSGVRFYSFRTYMRAITYTDAYNNYVFDSENKSEIVSNNNVINLSSQAIDYDLCSNKLDTILISGDLTDILTRSEEKTAVNATIERFCPFDTSKNFRVENCKLRKHGQSTLNYPITSMKFWLNKNMEDGTPVFVCEGQSDLGLAKNRYKLTDKSIPANKFVLQANYADSSGVHNGGLQRLIHDTWYNATIDGEYKLRTDPQLFATNETSILNDGVVIGKNSQNKQWGDYTTKDFPYEIRVSPDSIPCVVFYRNTQGDNKVTFLGQYVLMEDKKSDFNYGERSIYKVPQDPFCLTTARKNDDTSDNKIWDNTNVLRIEVLNINTPFSSYMSMTDGKGVGFEDIIYNETTGEPVQYRWEQDFEMIYPDPDDLNASDKFNANSKFNRIAKPFVDWYKWLVGTYKNQSKFEQEAAQHLDLYKMAAYYIFMLRFGLVDSCERNAQVKTYDGQHFHYEPWDMDIALGNKNTGGIAFNPPIDRNTTLNNDGVTYAISGRSGINGSVTSNWLWDALEAWAEWSNIIVPKVAQALYTSGLTYDNASKMFDQEYAAKWCEIIYNESGNYKYIEARGDDNGFLDWLQGARTTHRHWWLSTSMDYYDAKWGVGDFLKHSIYIAANKNSHPQNTDNVVIVPTNPTYLTIKQNDGAVLGTKYATKTEPASFDISAESLQYKVPFYIYGASYIESLDLSCIADGIDGIDFRGAYSEVLGAPMKSLNIGTIFTGSENHYVGKLNTFSANLRTSASDNSSADTFKNLETLNIRGQRQGNGLDPYSFRTLDRSQLKNIYAMGSTLTSFYSSNSGNSFNTLELPGINITSDGEEVSKMTILNFNNSSWRSLVFWNGTVGSNNEITVEKANVNGDYSLNIPSSIQSVTMTGSTCSNPESKQFVLDWIDCIIQQEGEDAIYNKSLVLDNINWSTAPYMTYQQLSRLAKFNGGNNKGSDGTMKGYIVLSNESELTAEQLTQIKAWFGDSVFNKNSSGLIIDQIRDYIQVNVGSNAYIDDGQLYLKEGNRASLNATKFALSEDSIEYNWFIQEPGSVEGQGKVYKSASIVTGDDGITYITTDESNYGDYDVEIFCTGEAYQSQPIILHIVGSTYPTQFDFNAVTAEDSSGNIRGSVQTSISFWQPSIISELYITPNTDYDASIQDVTFTLSSDGIILLNNISYTQLKGNDSEQVVIDPYLKYRKSAQHDYGIVLLTTQVGNSEFYKAYTLSAKVTFESGKTIVSNCQIIVINDAVAILENDASTLYKAINAKYYEQFGETKGRYYKYDLMSISGALSFSSNEYNTISSLRTQNNKSVLTYLHNITELDFSGCTNLLSTNQYIEGQSQLVFNNMTNLSVLNLNGCSSLTNDIDLSSNARIQNLDLRNTNISASIAENSSIVSYYSQNPTYIHIKNADNLNTLSFGSVNLTSYELINDSKRDLFSKFLVPLGQNLQHLIIQQNNSVRDTVTKDQIDYLYYALKLGLDSTTYLKGNLYCPGAYEDAVQYLNNKWDLTISTDKQYFRFNDPVCEQILASSAILGGDGVGVVTSVAQNVKQSNSTRSEIYNKFSSNENVVDLDLRPYTNFASTDINQFTLNSVQHSTSYPNIKNVYIPSWGGGRVTLSWQNPPSVIMGKAVLGYVGSVQGSSGGSITYESIAIKHTDVVGDYFFRNIHGNRLYLGDTTPPQLSFGFSSDINNRWEDIYVPEEALEAYSSADKWNTYTKGYKTFTPEEAEEIFMGM